MEKVQLILQLLHPYTFIPTSTVIREMRVSSQSVGKMEKKMNEKIG
jgi:Mn-dependent DtxR family transcriptional regulator